jgi:cytochrome c peroxidase
MFWDGRAATLEEQAMLPILNPVEMGQKDRNDVVAKLAAIPEFVEAFQKVFGRPPNWEDMGKAIAAFERTRLSTEAPFDRFLHGDEKALNDAQRRGWALFTGKARCGTQCSTQSELTVDYSFYTDEEPQPCHCGAKTCRRDMRRPA